MGNRGRAEIKVPTRGNSKRRLRAAETSRGEKGETVKLRARLGNGAGRKTKG
jgi:hypothetical protein